MGNGINESNDFCTVNNGLWWHSTSLLWYAITYTKIRRDANKLSYPIVDAKVVLVDALKVNLEDFQLSNLILPSKKSLTAIFELEALTSELLTFAKDPSEGMQLLPLKPREPNLNGLSNDESDRLKEEYLQLMRIYENQEKAFAMHIPYSDYITIFNFLKRFSKTLVATTAIKGNRFYSFTKNEERNEGGMFDFLKKKNNQQ